MIAALQNLRYILSHPLNRGQALVAFVRFLRWQVGSRLIPGEAIVPFVNSVRFIAEPGMTGVTGNIYCGLHEFEDMAFVLHALRPDDLFVDVGANVGSYTLLAGAAGCRRIISFEPVPASYELLIRNIALNALQPTVTPVRAGIGRESSTRMITSSLDTVNHVVSREGASGDCIEVALQSLDEALGPLTQPTFLKIDVEGFESEVLAGAASTLASPLLLGVIMELNGSGSRYGTTDAELQRTMLDYGFHSMCYSPFSRRLSPARDRNKGTNALFIRNLRAVQERLESAPSYQLWNGSV